MKFYKTSLATYFNVKLAVVAIFFFNTISAQVLTTTTYSTPGTFDWVVPACVTSVTVRAWGGGGAGAGAASTDRNGGGGGGGAYCTFTETVTPGETLRITVGAGGAAGSGNGGAGGLSQVQHLTGSVVFCRAAGGAGGIRATCGTCTGSGGSGGLTANNIPINTGFRGGNGGASDPNTASYDQSGGGGGGAGSGANGGNGGTPMAGMAGANFGGNGGAGILTTSLGGSNGNPGFAIGGGGGGATTYSSSRTGGAGARGEVRISYFDDGCNPADQAVSFSTPGTYNWVVPACVTSVYVQAWGGGGGGGGNIAVLATSGGETCTGAGGGGGGGYASRTYNVVPGQSYTIVVGAGGSAGAAGVGTTGGITIPAGIGGSGQSSTFSGPATVGPGTLTGTGGNGGAGAGGRNTSSSACLAIGGAAGTGSIGMNGIVNYSGGNGAAGLILDHSTDKSGGGGGGAGPGGNGGNAIAAGSVGVAVPSGGTGEAPGGNGGTGRMWNTPALSLQSGTAGAAVGGGGGGSLIHTSAIGAYTAIGGAGGRGEVRLTFSGACLLPIELSSFSGIKTERYNLLEWQTASENSNDYFTLERSIDGGNWTNLADVNGAGNSTLLLNYDYQDYQFTRNSLNYYRLSQTDIDGTKTFAGNIVSIDNREGSKKIARIINLLGKEVSKDTPGVVIYVFDDGSIERIVNL
jgi:hypothetical protein